MKAMFIIPPVTMEERYGILKDVGTLYPPLGLAYLAAIAEKAECLVEIVDAEAMGYSYPEIRRRVAEYLPDLIGLQTYCTNINQSLKVARIAKEINSNCSIVLGGAQATLFPKECLKNEHIDFVIIGEGEVVFENLLKQLIRPPGERNYGGIKGLFWKRDNHIIENPRQELIDNLDSIPLPARHLFPIEHYHASAQLRGQKILNIMTSRGCPYRCAYCSGHINFGRSFRYFSTDRVVKEINDMINNFRIDGLQFYDETFTVNRERVLELCRALIANNLTLPWSCFTRVNLVDRELLIGMKEAGCYQIFFGVESGSQRLLDLIKKDITLDQARNAVKLCKQVGIQSFCSFMLNLPGETIEESRQTIKFAIELNPDYVQFPITTPFPGTELYDIAKQYGRFVSEDWSKYMSWDEVVYVSRGRTASEIKQTVSQAYRSFYLRPGYLFKALSRFGTLSSKNRINLIKAGLKTIFVKAQDET